MKKIRKIFMTMLFLILLCILSACSSEQPQTDVAKELVSEDFVEIFLMAEDDFYKIFSEYQNINIEDSMHWVDGDDSNHIVIEFTYSSSNGSGNYGLDYLRDDDGNFELLQHGSDITIYSFILDKVE